MAMESAQQLFFWGCKQAVRDQRLLRNPQYTRRSTGCAEQTNGASQNEWRSEPGDYTILIFPNPDTL